MSALVILSYILIYTVSLHAQSTPPSAWSIDHTEEHVLHSDITGQDLRLLIRMPRDYYEKTEDTYPVLYYVDGHLYKDLVAGIARALEAGGDIPKMLLVGIDAEVENYAAWRARRSMHLTPTSADTYASYGIPASATGGGDAYLDALVKEIVPFIDAQYRTNAGDRTLAGHSFGGLFVLHALFSQHSSAFNRYLATSPSIPWDDRVLLRSEKSFAANHGDLPAHLYLSVGSLENELDDMMVHHLQELTTTLTLRAYQNLKMTSEVQENKSHTSVIPTAFSSGLSALFAQ